MERILDPISPDSSDREKAHARRAIDRLLAKAREEGIVVVEDDGKHGGVESILRQLGGEHP